MNSAFGIEIDTLVWLPSYVFYFFLGYYAFTYLSISKRMALLALALVFAGCVVQAVYIMCGDYGDWVRSTASVFIAPLALLAFLFSKRYLELPYKPRGVVSGLSSYSFGIYVLHPLFLNIAYKALHIGPWSLPPVFFELSMWAMAFFASIAMLWVMRRIPGVRKIL